jgi:hypothetical protein
MPFKSVTDADDLANLRMAFDVAWTMIESQKRVPLTHALIERDRLVHIVFTVWQADPDCDVASKAVEQFFATVPLYRRR